MTDATCTCLSGFLASRSYHPQFIKIKKTYPKLCMIYAFISLKIAQKMHETGHNNAHDSKYRASSPTITIVSDFMHFIRRK